MHDQINAIRKNNKMTATAMTIVNSIPIALSYSIDNNKASIKNAGNMIARILLLNLLVLVKSFEASYEAKQVIAKIKASKK